MLVLGVQKTIFSISQNVFLKKSGNPEIVAGNPGISSETTWESRVRRPGILGWPGPGSLASLGYAQTGVLMVQGFQGLGGGEATDAHGRAMAAQSRPDHFNTKYSPI